MKPLAFFAILAALVALGCATVDHAMKNARIEYQERGGLSAQEYRELVDRLADEDMESTEDCEAIDETDEVVDQDSVVTK